MTTVDNGRFKLIFRTRTAHYLWRERGSNALVLSDHSADDRGDDPTSVEATDDGVLYIDVKRLHEIGGFPLTNVEWGKKHNIALPLFQIVDGEVEKSTCHTTMPTYKALRTQPELQGLPLVIAFDGKYCAVQGTAVPKEGKCPTC